MKKEKYPEQCVKMNLRIYYETRPHPFFIGMNCNLINPSFETDLQKVVANSSVLQEITPYDNMQSVEKPEKMHTLDTR